MAGKNGRSDHCILVKKRTRRFVCVLDNRHLHYQGQTNLLVTYKLSTCQLVNSSTNLLVNFHSLARRIFHHVHALLHRVEALTLKVVYSHWRV